MRFLRENGLTLALLALFALSIVGQAVAGRQSYNQERALHDEAAVSLASYLESGDFISAVFENWESEFLQMSALVVLTVFLRQKGSPRLSPAITAISDLLCFWLLPNRPPKIRTVLLGRPEPTPQLAVLTGQPV